MFKYGAVSEELTGCPLGVSGSDMKRKKHPVRVGDREVTALPCDRYKAVKDKTD